jgi:hypothetical protein
MVARNYHRVPARKVAVFTGSESLNEVIKGVLIAGKLSKIGYASQGGSVLLARHKDVIHANTYTVLKEARNTGNPLRDLGLSVARDVAERMVSTVGCGGGTAVYLLAEILRYCGLRDIGELKAELDEYLKALPKEESSWEILASMAQKTKIPEIALEILRCWQDAGDYGTVAIREGHKIGIEIVEKEEAIFRVWPAESRIAENIGHVIESAVVAVCSFPLIREEDVVPLLELGSQWPQHPFVIFAPVIAGKALDVISINRSKGVGKFYGFWTKSMRLNQIPVLEDLAAFSGARIIHEGLPLTEVEGEWLGTIRRIEVLQDYTLCAGYPEHAESVESQIRKLEHLREGKCDNDFADRLKERIANLDGGFRILKVKGATDGETKWLMRESENWTAKMMSCIRNGITRDVKQFGFPSFISRDFSLDIPDNTVDPHMLWRKAFEIAMSGAEMIRSTGAIVCQIR